MQTFDFSFQTNDRFAFLPDFNFFGKFLQLINPS